MKLPAAFCLSLVCSLCVSGAFAKNVNHPWNRVTNDWFDVSVTGVDDIHLAYVGAATPGLRLTNRRDVPLRVRGAVRVETFGKRGFALAVDDELPPKGEKPLAIGRPLEKGVWNVRATLEAAGTNLVAETRFGVLARRKVTARAAKGVFRPGVNYHMQRYTDADNAKCLKALVQCGAKLVRAGIASAFCEVEPQEGEFRWKRTDAYLAQLERHGLDVDASFATAPKWAVDEQHQNLDPKLGGRWAAAMRLDAYREYCRRAAERYGTRIAWYEFGNELDLIDPRVLNTDELIAQQKAGYEGVKAGCPDAQVIPNGWAVVHSDVIPHRTQRDMQERLSVEAVDFYDAHPVHQHGPYREYRRRMGEFFAWREAKGIAYKRWYSNETAQSCVSAGEDRVASCVWQKMTYAWAHGSTDYIWYNLRSLGQASMDGEGGYGLVTGDFYPRMTYAAFAGYTSCFDGLRPLERVYEGVSREVYRFGGMRDGKRVDVLVGWDLRATTNVAVRVKTDAQRVFETDIFDNRREIPIRAGEVVLSVGTVPRALRFENANEVKPNAADLRFGEQPERKTVDVSGKGHRFVLNDLDDVFEMYKADPAFFDRVWKGPSDLSGRVSVRRTKDGLAIEAVSRDEKVTPGERLVVIVNGVETRFPPTATKNDGANFACDIKLPEAGSTLEIRIEDDDGHGKEGWITTGPFGI